jgi:hypothetical protein
MISSELMNAFGACRFLYLLLLPLFLLWNVLVLIHCALTVLMG